MSKVYELSEEKEDLIARTAAWDIYAGNVRQPVPPQSMTDLDDEEYAFVVRTRKEDRNRPILQTDINENGNLREATIRAKAAASALEAEGWRAVVEACERDGWTVDVAMEHAPSGLSTEEEYDDEEEE